MPSWTTPHDWSTGELVTATLLDTHLKDNLTNVHSEYGTTLPGSPGDQQMAILVDSTTNPTYHWQFRYNAGNSTSYKWEFIGGKSLRGALADISHANQTSYVMTNSPAATVAPVAGVYDIIITGTSQRCSGNTSYWAYNINGAGAADDNASTNNGTNGGALYFVNYDVTLAASDSVRIAYKASNTSTNHYLDNAQLSLMPVRVA